MTRNERYLASLMVELFQTERSAIMHCDREADRLGKTPPAHTLEDVADHARMALARLTRLADEGKIPAPKPIQKIGQAIGRTFSRARMHVFDHLIDSEKSYRGTLLGMRHGVDLVHLVHPLAVAAECYELAAWCTEWLEKRQPLLERAVGQLSWFANHPEIAFEKAGHRRISTSDQAAVVSPPSSVSTSPVT